MKDFKAVRRFSCIFAAVILLTGLVAGKAVAAWSTDPTLNNAISTAAGNQYVPTITSDGSGGAISPGMITAAAQIMTSMPRG